MELASSEEECNAPAIRSQIHSSSIAEMQLASSDSEIDKIEETPVSDARLGLASSGSEYGEPEETFQVEAELYASPPRLLAAYRVLFTAVAALDNLYGYAALTRSALVNGCGFSTHFSGLGSVEVAAGMLQAVVQSCFLGAKELTVRFGCELNRHRAQILLSRGNHCVLKNIMDYAPSLPSWSQIVGLSLGQRLILISKCFDARNTPCWRSFHLRCQPLLSQNHGDFSGSPCQAWSKYGKRRGWKDPRSLPFLVWIVFIEKMQPSWAIHECTPEFDGPSVVGEVLSDVYYIWQLHAQPGDCGAWAFIRRSRQFLVLIRKNVWLPGHDVCDTYRHVCSVICHSTEPAVLSDVLNACRDEWLLSAENKARAKLKQGPVSRASFDWRYLLTEKQRNYENNYLAQWRAKYGSDPLFDDSCLIDLSQARQLSYSAESLGYSGVGFRVNGF